MSETETNDLIELFRLLKQWRDELAVKQAAEEVNAQG